VVVDDQVAAAVVVVAGAGNRSFYEMKNPFALRRRGFLLRDSC